MSAAKSILIVEDESDLAEMLRFHLDREGYACRKACDGQTAIAETHRAPPDLIILDRMLPRVSGDDVLARLRADARSAAIPVIMLTAKTEETDQLVGFALGADDYVAKPFSMKVLLARVAAVLRREERAEATRDVIAVGPIVLDRSRYEVSVHGKPATLTVTEMRILGALMTARGRVLDRDRVIESVIGSGAAVTNRTVDVHIAALRKKLGDAGDWIHTVRGAGYAFRSPAE